MGRRLSQAEAGRGSVVRAARLPRFPAADGTRLGAEALGMQSRKVLNVGGGNKAIELPRQYVGFQHVLLDIDSRGSPDIVGDARQLAALDGSQFDAVYCSHNLEHYYR